MSDGRRALVLRLYQTVSDFACIAAARPSRIRGGVGSERYRTSDLFSPPGFRFESLLLLLLFRLSPSVIRSAKSFLILVYTKKKRKTPPRYRRSFVRPI